MIWKSKYGGYYSGEQRERGDVQMARIIDRHALAAHLDSIGHAVDPDTIDAVLRGLIELTPDGKDTAAWKRIHQERG